jgi:phage-related protein
MAIQIFKWAPDDSATCDSTMRTRKSQFGDGYTQVSGDGLNGEEDSWDLSFGGLAEEIKPIQDFIRAHGGIRAFLWTPPGGELGLYRCEKHRKQAQPGQVFQLTATFERAYHP